MKNKTGFFVTVIVLMLVTGVISVTAQSDDPDNPTVLTSTVIDGEGDGKGATVYYTFNALKGDVKITVDAKTDYYSTPVQVTLLDEDGKELLPIYVVALGEGKREVKTRRFVREQKVIVKITTRDDEQVKLLTYKIKIEGAVKVADPEKALPAQLEMKDGKKDKMKKIQKATKTIIDN